MLFDMSAPAGSKHLRVLERAGLIEQGRDKQRRPRRLRAEPLLKPLYWLLAYRPSGRSGSTAWRPWQWSEQEVAATKQRRSA